MEILKRKPFLRSQRAKAEKQKEQIAKVEDSLRQLNANEMRVAQLQRDVEIRDASFRRLATEAEQARIDHSLELAKITNISVAQPATRDLFPVFPNTKLNLLVGFVVALFVSTGLALLSDSRNGSIVTGN